nr:MAG TPA: hypothetical protein [Caudoviricetes sp.]
MLNFYAHRFAEKEILYHPPLLNNLIQYFSVTE